MNLIGTEFEKKVWNQISKITYGQTMSYKEIAEAIGHPRAYRAVANACGKNPYPEHIPCHRVIKSDGTIGGYSPYGGTKKKSQLLKIERD